MAGHAIKKKGWTCARYARERGVSRKTVTIWKQDGILTRCVYPDGSINAKVADQELAEKKLKPYNSGGFPTPEREILAAQEQALAATTPELEDDPDDGGIPPQAVTPASQRVDAPLTMPLPSPERPAAGLTLHDTQRLKLGTETQLKRLQLEKMQGHLIELDTAKALAFEWSRNARDAWVNFPARIGGELYHELVALGEALDQRQLLILLEKYVRQQLAELADTPAPQFTRAASG